MDFQSKRIFNSDMPVHCSSGETRLRCICGALNADQFQYLSKHSTTRTVQPGTELIGESTETDAYSIIISGVVKLSKVMADGRQQIVGLQFSPSLLGRPLGKKNGVNAEAATEVKVFSFSRSVMDRMIAENSELERKLLQQALDELDEARDWMLALGRKNADEKVASFLLFIAAHACPENKVESAAFDLPMSRSDIADFLGLTTETVSRKMTRLRMHDVIRISNNRRITIHDLAQLSKRAGL